MRESNETATPMEPYLKLNKEKRELLKDERRFQQLVGSLIYLTTTRPKMAFQSVSYLNLCKVHELLI